MLCLISNTLAQLEQSSLHQQFSIIITCYRPPATTISYSYTSFPEQKKPSSNRLGIPLRWGVEKPEGPSALQPTTESRIGKQYWRIWHKTNSSFITYSKIYGKENYHLIKRYRCSCVRPSFFNVLEKHGLCELWQWAGHGDTTQYIPIHTLATKIGSGMCNVLPTLHNLTGSDTNSKIGTKYATLKANLTFYLMEFGKCLLNFEDSITNAGVFSESAQTTMHFKTMDLLHYYKYHHSKNITFEYLWSYSLRKYILFLYLPLTVSRQPKIR